MTDDSKIQAYCGSTRTEANLKVGDRVEYIGPQMKGFFDFVKPGDTADVIEVIKDYDYEKGRDLIHVRWHDPGRDPASIGMPPKFLRKINARH